LDGIPLAIELAASKVSVLKVQQIAERLEDALRLLSGGRRTALPRHQTLRATIAWSYRLLSRAEQTLLRRLSVFSGSWTLEAAEVICTGRGIEQGDILALHVQLVDKSLVVLERQPGKVARYRWLDTIRQYTLEKLFEEGEAEVAFNFHCEWFLALSERAAVELMGPEQIQWLNRLEAERDNLRAALRWSTAREDPARALRLAASLADYWLMHAYFEEGIRWLQAALDLDVAGDRKAAPESRARALLGLTLLVIQPYGLGPFSIPLEELLEYCREALSIYRILNDDRGVVHAKYMLGRLTNLGGDTRSARAILGEALSMAQQNEDRWGSAKSLCALAYVAWLEGDMRAAKRLNEESLALEDRAGDVWYFATSLLRLAEIALRQGDILRAKELYEEALLRLQGTRMEHEIARIQRHLAVIQTLRLRFEEARSLLQAAQSFADRVGDQKALAFTKTYAGNLAYQQGDLIEARSQHEESLRLFQKLGDQYNVGWALANIGAVVCRRGDLPRAELLLKEGLALVEEGGDPADLTSTLQHVAHLMRMQGRYDQAIALDRRCLMEFDVVSLWPNSVEGLGQCAVALGQLERAVQLFGAGQRMREQLGTPVPPIALADHERSFSLAQKGLSAEAFSSAWKAGQEMTIQSLQAFAHSGDWPALFR
jgi:tetratricopeptide (TPR) repeat protein